VDNTVNADMIEFWNGDGGQKWLRFQDNMRESLAPFGHLAMDAAKISAGEQVLDVGCGCGDTTTEIARRIGSGGHVRGVDISKPILAEAKWRAASASLENVTFERADAQTHDFPPSAFDVVFSQFGVMFFAHPVIAFKNIRSAMKPGGRLAFVVWQSVKNNDWVSLSLDVVGNHVPLAAPLDPEEPGAFSFGDMERVKRILLQAGFYDIGVEGVSVPFVVGENLDYAATFLTQMGPAGGAIKNADASEETKLRIAGDMRDALGVYKTDRGIIISSAIWLVTAKNPFFVE